MTHTPGPWTNDKGLVNGRETRARFSPGVSVDLFDASEYPAELHDEMLGNAVLIAAAPDLWLVATELETAFETQIATGRCWVDEDDEYHVVITARQWSALGAALRKAEQPVAAKPQWGTTKPKGEDDERSTRKRIPEGFGQRD